MKSMKGMLMLALAALTFTVVDAYAQDTPAPAQPAVETPAPAQPAVEAQPAAGGGLQELEAALENIDAELVTISTVAELTPEQIQVIGVQDLIMSDAEGAKRVTESMTAKNDQVLALREALAVQAPVVEALKAADATVDQVIAARTAEDGKIIVFYE